jgi:small subunit ribosomal protein S4
MTDKKCKICRRAGEKLFLKGERCFTPKCGFTARPYAPGRLDSERKHRSQLSEYGSQMKEKQKIRNIYGVSEKQFSNYVKASTKNTGDNKTSPALQLYRNLETRLDNVVYRVGLAKSRALARQVVTHGHILVNGKRLDVPSHKIKVGDIVEIRSGSLVTKLFTDIMAKVKDVSAPK